MENIVDYIVKVGYDGRVAVVLSFASESPSLLGAEASGAKNALVKGIPAVKSGAEASLDESILKKDSAAEIAPDAEVDSDKATVAADEPSANAVFWSKLARPTDQTAPTGVTPALKKGTSAAKSGAEASFDETIKNDPALKPVIKNDPALKPVTEDAPAFLPVTAGGAPLSSIKSSIKEFPEEEPAPAGDADWTVSAKGISEWTTPSKSRRNNERKGASAPIDCSNGYGALGAGGIVGGADTGKAPSKGATVNVETTTIPTTTVTTPEGSASASDWFSMFCWPNALCTIFIALVLSGAAVAYSAHGSRGLVSNVMPDVTALDPMPEPNSGLLFASPDRHPTFAPRPTPPVPNPVDDPDWLVAASGFCSDFSFAPDGSIDFKFHPEVSVAFTDAPFHQAASLEDGIEIRGEEYSQTDVLAAGTWTNKNIALLEPISSCDDPPAGSQDEWAITVFKVSGNEACGEECVHFSGLISGASDNFVARKEGRFLCQPFVESHTFSDQARRSLRRRLAPTPLMTNMHMQPTARQLAFAPVPDIDLTASWLVATAGICSDLSVTPKSEMVAAESDADQSGTFVADITFKFHPETSVAHTKSPDHGAVEIGDDGVVIRDKAYTAVDVLTAAVWDLKNIALLEPTSSCDDPPAGSQDEWAVSVFKVSASDKCGADCVLYSGRVSASSSSLDVSVQKNGRFPCQLYVDSNGDGNKWAAPPRPPPPPPPLLNFKAGDVDPVTGLVAWNKLAGQELTCGTEQSCPDGTVMSFEVYPEKKLPLARGSYWDYFSILTYPDNGGAGPTKECPTGFRDVYDAAECESLARSTGLEWVSKLSNDANWIHGCFEWYSGNDWQAQWSSKVVYWNERPFAKTGKIGGHKICVTASNMLPSEVQDGSGEGDGCYDANWWGTFDSAGWSECADGYAIVGLYFSDCKDLHCLEMARCCPVAYFEPDMGSCTTEDNNVRDEFNYNDDYYFKCTPGGRGDYSYIKGLYRTDGDDLHNLESFKCCRFDVGNTNSVYQYEATTTYSEPNCKDVDVSSSGDFRFGKDDGWFYCPKNMVMAGMFQADVGADNWFGIDKIWCCEITGKKRALRYGSLPTEVVTDKKDVAGCSEDCSGYQFMALSDTGACTCDNEWPSVTKYGTCGNQPAGCNTVYDLKTPAPVTDEVGSWVCLAPADGYYCVGGNCGLPFTCDAWKAMAKCPSNAFTCLAKNASSADLGVLKHGSECWFPKLSPIGLMLTDPNSVLVDAAQAELKRQCGQPPFLFAYDAGHKPANTFASPGLGPPSRFGCDVWSFQLEMEPDLGSALEAEGVAYSAENASFSFGGDSFVRFPRNGIGDGDFSIQFEFKTDDSGCGDADKWYEGCGLVDATVVGAVPGFGVSIGNGRVMFGVGSGSPSGDVNPTLVSADSHADGNWHSVLATRKMLGFEWYDSNTAAKVCCPTYDQVMATPSDERRVEWDDSTCSSGCKCSSWGPESEYCTDDALTYPDGHPACLKSCESVQSEIALYVDGVNVGTKLVGTPSLSASLKIDIGRLQTASATNYYTGELRNVRVTAEALAGPSAAPSNRKWIYDSTLGKAASGATEEEQWDEICGEYFWSLYAPTYDWSALLANGAVTGCVGPLCIDAEELPPKNPDGCSTAGDGCSFTEHVDRYAAQVVYAAQLRTRQIAHGERLHMYTTVNGVDFSDSRWDTVPIMQVFNLQAVAAGLAGFQAALKASGASGGSLTLLAQMETSVRAMAVKLNTMPNVGYVPNFNFEFYTTELSEYMKDFEDYVATMQDLAKAELAMKARYQQLAIVATEQAGQKSVAQLTQKSTEQTISAAMTGMNAALKGLKHAGDLMNETAVALEDAIDRYEEEQRKARRRAMIFGCISLGLQLVTGGLGVAETVLNIGSESAKTKDKGKGYTPWRTGTAEADKDEYAYTEYTSMYDVLEPTKKSGNEIDYWKVQETSRKGGAFMAGGTAGFIGSAQGVASSSMAIKQINDDDCRSKGCVDPTSLDMPPSIVALAESNLAAMEDDFGWNASTMLYPSTGDGIADLSVAAWSLNHILPRLGTGFWTEYYANSSTAMTPYTIGYNTEINTLALKWLDLQRAQCDYGNDYVTHGTRFTAGIQQYLIDQAQIKATEATQAAINNAFEATVETYTQMVLMQSKLSINMTNTALDMYVAVNQLCRSYQYQQTRLYEQCVHPTIDDDKNELNKLCAGYTIDYVGWSNETSEPSARPDPFTPFTFDPFETDSWKIFSDAEEYLRPWEDVAGEDGAANKVACYVTNEVWGSEARPAQSLFAPLTIRPFRPPPPDSSAGYIFTRYDICTYAGDVTLLASPNPQCPNTIEGGELGTFPTPKDCATAAALSQACYDASSTTRIMWASPDDACYCCGADALPGEPGHGGIYSVPRDNGVPFPVGNESLPLRVYYPGSSCLLNESVSLNVSQGETCCNVTEWFNNATSLDISDAPVTPGRIWVTEEAWSSFTDKESESWGVLNFEITPEITPDAFEFTVLHDYSEIFVRGYSAYLVGAVIDNAECDVTLELDLTPSNRMLNRVWSSDGWKYYTFLGAPSSSAEYSEDDPGPVPQTVSYAMSYKPAEPQSIYENERYETPKCCSSSGNSGALAQPVFSSSADATSIKNRVDYCPVTLPPFAGLPPKCIFTGSVKECPCYWYCTNDIFESFEKDYYSQSGGNTGSYNFASLYSGFQLRVTAPYGTESNKDDVDLAGAEEVKLGMWLRQTQRNLDNGQTYCDNIGDASPCSWPMDD